MQTPPGLNDRIVDLLQDLNDKMGLMVDVIEKHPRSGVPNSMYFNIERRNAALPGIEKPQLTEFSGLTDVEKRDVYAEYGKEFAESHQRMIDGMNRLREIAQDEVHYSEEYRDHASEALEDLQRRYKLEKEAYVAAKHNEKVQENIAKLKKLGYKNGEAYLEEGDEKVAYKARTIDRRDTSSEIAHSGLGNTMLGRGAQNLLNARQRADDIVNFGFDLKNGGAKNMANSLFGNGAVAKGATKALGGFGNALTKLGGPISGLAYGFKMGWDAVKKFADVVNWANAYILRIVKYQTNLDKLAYEKNAQLANLQNELDVERIKYFGDLQLKQVEIESENLKRAVEISTSRFVKATEIAVGPLTDGINETAYKAAEANIDLSADVLKFQKEMGLRAAQYGLFEKRRGTEFGNVVEVNAAEAERTKAKYDYDAVLSTVQTMAEMGKDLKGDYSKRVLDGMGVYSDEETNVDSESMSSHELPNGRSETMGGVYNRIDPKLKKDMESIYTNRLWDIGYDKVVGVAEQKMQNQRLLPAEWEKQQAEMGAKLSNTIAGIQEQIGQKQVETATEVAKTYIDAAAEMKKTWLQLAKKTENWVEEFDTMTNDLGINLGYTTKQQLKSYQESLFGVLENTVSKFGKDREDMVKMQQGYIETTGRQKLLNESDYGQLFGLGKYLGDDGLAAQFASGMEIFNAGASESVDLLDDALQNVNRIGLNGRKYAKEVANNLKMAQKYNFKGGTKGFMEMAKWAEKTRFNIASLGGMLDKVQEGGLEGVIKQSAEFQVLGGHAAMNSDPLGMMFDAWADPEAYAKRMQDMTKGFGTVDQKTGETKFNINESMQMAQLAKIQGRSVEEVRGEVMDRNRREAVINSLSQEQRRGMSQEELDFLGSSAQYNRKTGQFEVNVKQADGTYKATSVNEIQSEDLKNLMPEKHEERMEVYMQDVLSAIQGVKGEEIAERANAAAATYEEIINQYAERTRIAHEAYAENRDKYINEIIAGSQLATNSFHDFIGVFEQGNSDLSEAEKQINAQADKISEALGGVSTVINTAVSKIQSSLDNFDENRSKPIVKNQTELDRKLTSSLERGKDREVKVEYQRNGKTVSEDEFFGRSSKPRGGVGTRDGVVDGNGQSMTVEAQNIIPINDGAVTRTVTHPDDIGIFAKDGGPFDKLFNGVFGQIRNIHDAMVEHQKEGGGVMPDYLKMANEAWSNPYEYAKRMQSAGGSERVQPMGKKDVNVNINGRLTLDGGGQQIDLLQILKSNPDLVRKITEVVVNQMSSNENGGKYEMFSNRYYR